jgi:hypothetical protein
MSSVSPSPKSLSRPSEASSLLPPVIHQTAPLWKRRLRSAWSVAHGVTTFFFPEMELPVKAFYGHQGIF